MDCTSLRLEASDETDSAVRPMAAPTHPDRPSCNYRAADIRIAAEFRSKHGFKVPADILPANPMLTASAVTPCAGMAPEQAAPSIHNEESGRLPFAQLAENPGASSRQTTASSIIVAASLALAVGFGWQAVPSPSEPAARTLPPVAAGNSGINNILPAPPMPQQDTASDRSVAKAASVVRNPEPEPEKETAAASRQPHARPSKPAGKRSAASREESQRLKAQANSKTNQERLGASKAPVPPPPPKAEPAPESKVATQEQGKDLRQALAQCERKSSVFQREKCKWRLCNGQWGENGCPSYNQDPIPIYLIS